MDRRRPPVLVLVLIGLGLVGLAVVGVGTGLVRDGESGGKDKDPVETARVRIRGAGLPLYRGATKDPAVGQPAPQVRGTPLGGRGSLRIPRDGAKVVVFVAHWCPHCQAEVKKITQWVKTRGEPENVELFAVSTDVNSGLDNYPPSAWLQRENWPIQTIADDANSSAGKAYGVTGYPFVVVTDADGNVVVRTSGSLTTAQLEALVGSAGGRFKT